MSTRNLSIALLAAITVVVAACSNSDRPDPPVAPMNAAPVVGAIADVTASQDSVVGPLEFSVNDDMTPPNQLTVTAAVDGGTPFPADAVALGGSGTARSITLTPLESATGTANVTVRVIDGQGLVTSRAFRVQVNERSASVRDAVLSTFGKADADDATPLNGFTFAQDADDPATFAALLGDQ